MLSGDDLEFQAALAGQYSIDRELGRGGMGIVYLAREVVLDRPVAIKRLPPRHADDPVFRERFIREARTAAQLFHPNIVPIHRVDSVGPFDYFVMSYVEGESVGQRVRRLGPRPVAEAARILRDVALALGYGHARGVVHRDVKPDNLLVEQASGRTFVTDFGIARQAGASSLTSDGQLLGSVHYMSPEQLAGETVDGRADVYALGALAHFLLTGRPPFDAPSATAVIGMQLNAPAPQIAEVARGVPGRLAAAIDRCLAKDPADRFPTAEAFAEALTEVGEKRAVAAPLRAWASGGGWVDPGLFLVGGVSFLAIMITQDFWLLAAPPAYALMQRLRLTRSVLAQGYDANDLAAAIVAEVERHAEESAAHFSARPSRWVRALRWAAGGFAVASIGLAVWAERVLARLNTVNVATAGEIVVRLGGAALLAGGVAVVTGLVAEAIAPSRILDRLGGSDFAWRLRFWKSRRGHLLARWLRRGTRPSARADADRPTEVIVGSAVSSLYEALPRSLRRELAALPQVVAQLEDRARALRERRAKMESLASIAATPSRVKGDDAIERRQGEAVDELEAARQAVDRQLAATVSALETLRLDLLRLHAGSGSTADLTAALGAAARIGDEVTMNLDARAAVDRMLRADHALSP